MIEILREADHKKKLEEDVRASYRLKIVCLWLLKHVRYIEVEEKDLVCDSILSQEFTMQTKVSQTSKLLHNRHERISAFKHLGR